MPNVAEAEPEGKMSDSDSDGGDASEDNEKKVSEFRTPDTLTTVTVVEEMDDEFGFGGIVEDKSGGKKVLVGTGSETKKEYSKAVKETKEEGKETYVKYACF